MIIKDSIQDFERIRYHLKPNEYKWKEFRKPDIPSFVVYIGLSVR
jgi:hypothetical protein